MKRLIFDKLDARVFVDVYLSMRTADPYITGRARMGELTKVFDKLEKVADVQRSDDGQVLTLGMPLGGVTVDLEDTEFAILKECTAIVCEQGINDKTAESKQIGRIFDVRRAMAVLDFMDDVKAPVPAEAAG